MGFIISVVAFMCGMATGVLLMCMLQISKTNEQERDVKRAVEHPDHYNIPGRKECIDEMLELFGVEKVKAFCELNSYKYRYRHEMKNGEEDLKKAEWYDKKLEELS